MTRLRSRKSSGSSSPARQDDAREQIAPNQQPDDPTQLRQQLSVARLQAAELAEQARSLASQLTMAEQRERQKLALMLHDDMQQILVAAKYNLETLLRRSRDRATGWQCRRIGGLLDKAIEQTRSLSWQLCPPILQAEGLAAALHWLARDLAAKGILIVHCRAERQAEPPGEDVQALLFQSARELLLNVAKHAGVGDANLDLRRDDAQGVRLHISDRGRGFDPALLDGRKHTQHFGLLSIKQRLLSLGGRMQIQSRAGIGTCVELLVPAGASQQPEPPAASPARHGNIRRSGRKIRLLLVDDHEIVRKGLVELLRAQPDIQVVGEATNGQSAIESARSCRPDVVVMDVSIPGIDGLEATRQIVEAAPGVRVIGLSMHEARYMRAAMRRAGAAVYLNKAGPPKELINAIRGHAGRRHRSEGGRQN